ncbi:MAG: D-alanine--D-alanine ligase [Candidatus Cloacimonadaceae bacterium]
MQKIVVLLGGKSPERKVSLVSGSEISKQLKLNGYQVIEMDPADYETGHELISAIDVRKPDLVFIGLHGGEGENGILQAMLAGSRIPFTGSDYKASAVAMDKLLSKIIAMQIEVPVPKHKILYKSDYQLNRLQSFDDYQKTLLKSGSAHELVVKPNDAGSSVGVHIVKAEKSWLKALADAFRYAEKVLVEEYIEGRELTVTILDKEALPVVEIKPHNGFYDYPNKYTSGNTDYIAPAELNQTEVNMVQDYAVRIWQAMECSGYGRIDFRYDGKTFYFLEVNTLPGMTPLSLTPMAAKAVGISFGDLLDRIIGTLKR